MGRRLNAAPPPLGGALAIACKPRAARACKLGRAEALRGDEHGQKGSGTESATTTPDLRPHDLLELRTLPDLAVAPPWVKEALVRTPFVVVRRAEAAPGCVAVGVRGATRSERYGMAIERADIRIVHTPESLLRSIPSAARAALLPFAVLRSLQFSAAFRGFAWGPTGSTGFELATGRATLSTTSDLDLLLRTPQPLSRHAAQRIHDELTAHALKAGIRIDAQLETPAGGVALAEWAGGRPRVLVRSHAGPYLSADPWHPEAGSPARSSEKGPC